MAAPALKSVVAPGSRQVSAELGGEAVILQLDSGIYYGLDPVGARVWALLQEPIRVDTLRDRLLAEYVVEPGRLERDLLALLARLADVRLIEIRHEGDG